MNRTRIYYQALLNISDFLQSIKKTHGLGFELEQAVAKMRRAEAKRKIERKQYFI